MGRVANGSIDDLGMKWCILVGDVGVKLTPRLLAVFQVYLASELTPASSLEVLAIRR